MNRPPVWDRLARVGVLDAAARLGLTVRRQSFGPCPACGASHRGAQDRRLPCGARGDGRGWMCHQCGISGDTAGLIQRRPGATIADVEREAVAAGLIPGDDGTWHASPHPPPPVAPQQPPELPYAPPHEVAALLGACTRADDDAEVAALLLSRRLDPARCADAGALAYLPRPELLAMAAELAGRDHGTDALDSVTRSEVLAAVGMPPWAALGSTPWCVTHRLVVATYGPSGEPLGVRARYTGAPQQGARKEVGGRGVRQTGCVYADPVGQRLLRSGPDTMVGDWWSGVVVMVEGIPDFLTMATARRHGPSAAVLGVWPGAVYPQIASRLPRGCVVQVATDADRAGDRIAARIVDTLHSVGWRGTQQRCAPVAA